MRSLDWLEKIRILKKSGNDKHLQGDYFTENIFLFRSHRHTNKHLLRDRNDAEDIIDGSHKGRKRE